MNMYLAFILGLCALAIPSVATSLPAQLLPFSQGSLPPSWAQQSGSEQQSVQDAPPAAKEAPPASRPPGSQTPDSEKTGSEKAGSEKTPPATPAPDAVPQPQKSQPEAATKPTTQAKTPPKRRRRRKPAASHATAATPKKKVVRNGGTADPVIQLAPGVTDEQASRQRQSTTQLLATTDTNLKQISARQLNPSQQESVSQIRKYMEQAKAADAAGDVQRAQNLASKALLLSDDLAKH